MPYPTRTLLALRIRQRQLTLEEFVAYAEAFARDHGEGGSPSVRHLQRLASGRGANGERVGRPRPATARLLERIFNTSIDELLAPPTEMEPELAAEADSELLHRLHAFARVDDSVLAALRDQLTATRRLDRQLGAVVAHDEVLAKIEQITRLMNYSISATTREHLAGLLSELHCLAGWQALDTGDTTCAWEEYSNGVTAGAHCTDPAYAAHSSAGQAFVLIDLGDTSNATDLLASTRERCEAKITPLISAWLAAAHGEALAADNQQAASLRAYDTASALLPAEPSTTDGPYVALDNIHLARWRGHALARLRDREAINVLSSALDRLDPTFTRAETALHVDLATALAGACEYDEAREHATRANTLAGEIGSKRQRRRIRPLLRSH